MENCCRVCAKKIDENEQLINIFEGKLFIDLLYNLTSLKIIENANLPSSICSDCIKSLEEFSEFKEKCISVYNLYAQNVKKKEIKKESSQDEDSESYSLEQKTVATNLNDLNGSEKLNLRAKCEYCNNAYSSFKTLNHHIKENHWQDNPLYVCSVENCDKAFRSRHYYYQHRRTHKNGAASRVCDICGNSFSGSLNRHRQIHSDVKPFTCKICGKSFRRNDKMKSHLKTHDSARKFECSICHILLKCAQTLKNHMNIHTREHQFECSHENCGKVFLTKVSLKKHVSVVHLGIRSYHCTYCDQSFGKMDTLKHHTMIHTGEKPHKCKDCGKRFIQLVALKTHMRTHVKLNDNHLKAKDNSENDSKTNVESEKTSSFSGVLNENSNI